MRLPHRMIALALGLAVPLSIRGAVQSPAAIKIPPMAGGNTFTVGGFGSRPEEYLETLLLRIGTLSGVSVGLERMIDESLPAEMVVPGNTQPSSVLTGLSVGDALTLLCQVRSGGLRRKLSSVRSSWRL